MEPDQTRRQGEPRPRLVSLGEAVAAIQRSLSSHGVQPETVTVEIGVELISEAPNGAPLLYPLEAVVAAPGEASATVRVELRTRQAFAFPPPFHPQTVAGATSHTSDPFSPPPQSGMGKEPGGPTPVINPNRPNISDLGWTPPGPPIDGDEDED